MSSHPNPNAGYAPEPHLDQSSLEWARLGYIPIEPRPDMLAEIATLVRSLTYEEMITLAEGIGIEAAKLHEWSKNRET